MHRRQTALTLLILSVSLTARADWPQFRGPGGQGHSDDRRLPLTWSEQKNVAWKIPLPGRGWSSPVVLGDQIWMTTALDGGKSLRALCVDLKSGRLLHNVEVFAPRQPVSINSKNSHASPTPVVEKGRVYVHFGTMGTACLDTRSGKVLWSLDRLKLEHKEGPGSSPLLFDDFLIVNCDGMDVQYVTALHKQTGKTAWKTNRSAPLRENPDFRKAFSTPLIISAGGKPQLLSAGADQVNAYDPRTGRELWRVRCRGFSTVPRPLFAAGVAYVVSDYGRPQLWAMRTDGQGDVTNSHVLWQFSRQVPASPSPILVNGRLYMASNRGVATCLDAATGRQIWQHRLGGNFSASPVSAAGRIYFCSEAGKTTVIAPAAKYHVLATNQIDGRLMASPAIVDGAIMLRSDTHLYRIEDRSAAVIPSRTENSAAAQTR